MISKLKKFLVAAASVSIIAIPVLAPAAVMAQGNVQQGIESNLCGGTNASTEGGACGTAQASTSVSGLFTRVINFFSLLVGIVSVIMIIIGGFQYIISNGDSGKISTAKNTIIFALVGLIIVAMAQFIVHFILGKIGGISS